MRASQLRFASASLLFALIAGIVVWVDSFAEARQKVVAQPLQPGVKDEKGKGKDDKDKDLRPEEDWDLPFSPPYERDAKNQLQGARDYLVFKEVPWNTVCPLLQNILDAKSDSFFNIKDKAGDKTLTRRISVKTEANRIISAFKKEGLEFYQQSYGQTAANLLKDAVKDNYDMAMLSDLSQRYFHTEAGAEGTILLGSIYLERGNYLEAAYAFERLMLRPNSDEVLTPRTLFKAAIAFKRSGDPRHATLAQATTDRLQKATARNGLVIGRTTFPYEKLKAEIDRPITAIRTSFAVGEWTGRYGNAQRNGLVDGGPPFLVPAFEPTRLTLTRREKDREPNDWIDEELNRLFDRENKTIKSLQLPGFFPITTSDLVIFRSYDGVHAVATRDLTVTVKGEAKVIRAGDLRWTSRTRFGIHQLQSKPTEVFNDPDVKTTTGQWWGQYKSPNVGVGSLLYENPLLGSLAHDGQNVYFLDDVAIPPPPSLNDPNAMMMGGMPNQGGKVGGELAEAVRAGQLIAVSLQSGSQVWTLGRPLVDTKAPVLPRLNEEEADKSTSAYHLCLNAVFLGVPLPLNGRLYSLIELDGIVRLLCLDPKAMVDVKDFPQKVPSLIWTQKLGRPNTILPGDSVRRFQGAFLAAGEGILICPTNSGLVIGVDIMSRSLLWAHAYRRLEASAKPVYNQMTGMMEIPGSKLDNNRWRAAAPIVSGGRVVISAYDSIKLECLDVRSGRLLWSTPRDAADLYVGGVVNDKVIVVGKNSVRAYQLNNENADLTPKSAWVDKNGAAKACILNSATPTGHGIAAKNVFYVPIRQENAGKDNVPPAEIWAINLETGNVSSKTSARLRKDGSGGSELLRYGIGNLVFQDGQVISQSAWEVAVYPQLEQKKAEMDRLLKANPKDPKGLFRRGELNLDDGKLNEAVADFKEAEKNAPPEEIRAGIRDNLYVAYTEMLREKFSENEGVLKEYITLCEVSTDGDLEPFEKKRREDESLRRKRLYYYLLAKGREDQKRLGEAFDHYLTLASLGEGKNLFEMPDEPSVKMRPDVWARGRIEGMIRRAADATARKSLEDRVNKEWDDVRGNNDLKKLREFVDVFGPYFPAGSAAEFQLAETLLATGADDDTRDAQVHLSQLRATAEDPAVRAKATETLARLMIKNQLMEDAVGLYLQLGKEFPTVVIRDGKTGADFLTDLLTDRRLLPYLEPARYPLPPKVKVEQVVAQNNGQMGAMFEVEPEGDLFPMYRRLRFVIDMVSSGNNSWTLRGYDRSSGAERCTFRDLAPPMQYNPGNWQSARHVQGCGHILLVQVGHWVYCLDLAEKKERWRKNLLGDGMNLQPNQIVDTGVDGEVYIQYTDGTKLTIGKSSIIQPGYVCILTRDGLEVVEPTTRRQLWTRRNVDEKTYISGDSRYILMVATNATSRKPESTKLIRAVDGMTVEGAPNAAPIMAAAKSFRIYGRNVLLTETAGDKQVLRLYDTSNGKDVWRQEYDAKAVPLKSLNLEWTGFVKQTGEVEILATATGKPLGAFKLDPNQVDGHMKGCIEAQLFADSDRFYVVLDRTTQGVAAANRRIYGYTLRTQPVNGPIYAFDRNSGKRLWFVENVLENQWLVMERFGDLPVLLAAAPILEKNVQNYKVVVIEKDQGAIRWNRGIVNNGNYFQNLTVDLKNGTIDLHRYDTRIHIKPEERPAGK